MRLAIAVLALLAAVVPAAGAQSPPAVPGEFVVQFARGADRATALRDNGARAVDRIAALDALVVRMPADRAARAKADRRFSLVEPNRTYTATLTPGDPSFGQQWAFPKISAPAAWDITTGAPGAVVAVVDTGVQSGHPDLDGKLVAGYDFVSGDSVPEDGNGHGTHVAGSAAAVTGNTAGGAGTCPGCSVMPVRVLDDSGSGTLANVAKGITHAADNGADVINLSLGGGSSSTLQQAVDHAASRGAFLACAAGNSSTSSTTSAYPAAYANCFAVASTTQDDSRSSFSNFGSWVEVAAPGSDIFSTWIGSSYRTISGTSMATPHVAGLAGLLASQGRTAAEARDVICATSDQIAGTGSLWTCGRINAHAAVTGPTPAPPPADGIEDGGFDAGTTAWTASSSTGRTIIADGRATLGAVDSTTDAVRQSVLVPAGAKLRYVWTKATQETGGKVRDRLRVRVLSSSGSVLATLRTLSNASGGGGTDTVDLASWAGQSVLVEFQGTTDGSRPTTFTVDDVALAG